MGLQRDVAQILQRNDPKGVGMIEHGRHRQRDLLQQRRYVRERKRRELDRSRVERQHERRAVGRNDPKIFSIRRVSGERHDAGGAIRQAAVAQVLIDAVADVRPFGCALVEHYPI